MSGKPRFMSNMSTHLQEIYTASVINLKHKGSKIERLLANEDTKLSKYTQQMTRHSDRNFKELKAQKIEELIKEGTKDFTGELTEGQVKNLRKKAEGIAFHNMAYDAGVRSKTRSTLGSGAVNVGGYFIGANVIRNASGGDPFYNSQYEHDIAGIPFV